MDGHRSLSGVISSLPATWPPSIRRSPPLPFSLVITFAPPSVAISPSSIFPTSSFTAATTATTTPHRFTLRAESFTQHGALPREGSVARKRDCEKNRGGPRPVSGRGRCVVRLYARGVQTIGKVAMPPRFFTVPWIWRFGDLVLRRHSVLYPYLCVSFLSLEFSSRPKCR